MGKYRYGTNFKMLKALYVMRHGNKKGAVAFVRNELMPISNKDVNGRTEINSEQAWEIVKTHYPKWLEKRQIENWQEVMNFVNSNCFTDGERYLPYAGTAYNGKEMFSIVQRDYDGVVKL